MPFETIMCLFTLHNLIVIVACIAVGAFCAFAVGKRQDILVPRGTMNTPTILRSSVLSRLTALWAIVMVGWYSSSAYAQTNGYGFADSSSVGAQAISAFVAVSGILVAITAFMVVISFYRKLRGGH